MSKKNENQNPQRNKSAEGLHEKNGVEITGIYNIKGQVGPFKANAERSVGNEQQVYANPFEDNRNNHSLSRNGPSITLGYEPEKVIDSIIGHTYKDFVTALPAFCPDYIHQWSSRKRNHNFPTVEQIERIPKMEAHVVPVGCKETHNADLQWRICFTMGEVELIQSLNGIQLKLYVLLKMLTKNVIKPECPGIITSYVMKNVVLWIAELKPRDHFREENLENCLIEAVHFLRLCVRSGFMPNYMIHSRNLLQGRLSLQDRGILLKLLGSLVQEKGMMVMRCEKLRHNLNCPYISRLFTYAGNDTQLCADIFRKFLEPALLNELTDMEDVLTAFLKSVERGFDKQETVIKMRSMSVLNYVKTWIIGLPYKSAAHIEKRSQMRIKCGELKQDIAKSVVIDLPNFRSIIEILYPIIADVYKATNEQNDRHVNALSSIECIAKCMVKLFDYFGNSDMRSIISEVSKCNKFNFMSHSTQTASRMHGAQQTGENQQQYSDLDLD